MDNQGNNVCVSTAGKKRRLSDHDLIDNLHLPNKDLEGHCSQFLAIPRSENVFQTEEWRAADTSLFHPVTQDLLVNIRNVEQISCSDGHHFVADLSGNYTATLTGKVIHLWRYDKKRRSLYISRSFLFTALEEFLAIQQYLQRI